MIGNPGVNPTERIFSPQTVCVPATGVYLARALRPELKIPGTKAEVLALALDMGAPNGVGANFAKLQAGMLKRYGLKGAVTEGAQAAIAAVRAAQGLGPFAAGLAGDQLNLAPHYQGNHVSHAIAVLYPFAAGSNDVGTQLDPLAPAGYRGDAFGLQELSAYCTAAIIFSAPDDTAALKAEIVELNTRIKAAKAALG